MENIQETAATAPTRDERVGQVAYQIWVDDGKIEGKSEEHWLLACAIVDAEITLVEAKELPAWLSRQTQLASEQAKAVSENTLYVKPLSHRQLHRSAA